MHLKSENSEFPCAPIRILAENLRRISPEQNSVTDGDILKFLLYLQNLHVNYTARKFLSCQFWNDGM